MTLITSPDHTGTSPAPCRVTEQGPGTGQHASALWAQVGRRDRSATVHFGNAAPVQIRDRPDQEERPEDERHTDRHDDQGRPSRCYNEKQEARKREHRRLQRPPEPADSPPEFVAHDSNPGARTAREWWGKPHRCRGPRPSAARRRGRDRQGRQISRRAEAQSQGKAPICEPRG